MFQITPAFAVPFVEAQLPQSEALNAELHALFLAREAEGRVRNPATSMRINPGLFESEFNLFSWPDACVPPATPPRSAAMPEAWARAAIRGGCRGSRSTPATPTASRACCRRSPRRGAEPSAAR